MKKSSFLVAICAVLCTPLLANASRIYVDSANIKVMPEGLFLEFSEGLMPIETVCKDGEGVFITTRVEQEQLLHCASCGVTFDLEEQSPYCPHPLLRNR